MTAHGPQRYMDVYIREALLNRGGNLSLMLNNSFKGREAHYGNLVDKCLTATQKSSFLVVKPSKIIFLI